MPRGSKHPIADWAALTLCVMLVLFPKGGFRFGLFPITWAYLLLFASLVLFLPYRLFIAKARYVRRQLVAFFCIAPFTIVLCYSAAAFGLFFIGGFVSTFISLVFFPVLFLWFYPPLLGLLNQQRFVKSLRYCILAAALFGIFLFFWRPITGTWIQVPYLTVNAGDAGDFATTKSIARGGVFKLISTYNNGNLYGAATIIVLRLHKEIVRSRWQYWVVWIAMFLTLSRTVWAGLLFDQLLSLAALFIGQRERFPVLKLGRLAWALVISIIFTPTYFIMSRLLGIQQNHGFLLDPTLGGRTSQFTQIGSATFFPASTSTFFFTEITYLSAINLFGYIGFVVVTLLLLSPVLIVLFDKRALRDRYRRAAFKGLLLYALISTGDGAINFIPIMAFYWFTYMIFLFGLPGHEAETQMPTSPEYPVPLTPHLSIAN